MSAHPAIPQLTPDENAMTYQASQAGQYTVTTFVLAYLHWSKARGDMLANVAIQTPLPVVSVGQAWLNSLPYDHEEPYKEGASEDA